MSAHFDPDQPNPYAPPRHDSSTPSDGLGLGLSIGMGGPRGEGVKALEPKTCPACGAQVSFFRVYLALGPRHVRCGSCRSRLGYDELVGPGLVLLGGLGLLGALLFLVGAGHLTGFAPWAHADGASVTALVLWGMLGIVVLTALTSAYVWHLRRLRCLWLAESS